MNSPKLPRSSKRFLPPLVLLLVGAASLQGACSDTINNEYITYESSAGSPGVGEGEGGEGGVADPYPGAPTANTTVADHELDLFGTMGNRFWFAVSDEQLAQMNSQYGGGVGPIFLDAPANGDLYSPGGGSSANYVDHLWITSAGEGGKTADYGKVQVKLVGQSTGRPWNEQSIPNMNVDSNEFVKKQRIDGFEHLRFANAQVGSIFRERLTLELYDKLGYPAPLSQYVWVTSNVWGSDISVPYILVERYKRDFCERESDLLGGGCVNMWEFVGDVAQGDMGGGPIPLKVGGDGADIGIGLPGVINSVFDDPNNCQIDECQNSRVKELEELLIQTEQGEGFKAATADYVDWPSFHRFQCLSWVLATGDDALHNQNNVVLVERSDGKFQYLPYSIDISLGQDWYPYVSLPGQNVLARGCQADESCWADLIAECEDVIEDLEAAKPIEMLEALHDQLDAAGMLRDGDEGRYEFLRNWFETRLEELPIELEANREAPMICDYGQVDCGGYCDYAENCGSGCVPPVGKPGEPMPVDAMDEAGLGGAGGDGGGGNECPIILKYAVE